MQSACIGSLMELAEKDKKVLYLTADSGEGGLDKIFRMNFPEQAIEFGIAEGNMVAAAAGLATTGRIPFVYTAGSFLAYRSFEFIRDDVCIQNLNVKMIGTGSGLSVSSLGPTHHTTEDIAVLRALPGLMILSPSTPLQASACIKLAYRHNGPVYIRLGMNKERELYESEDAFDLSRLNVLSAGSRVAVFSTGSIVEEVMKAADLLGEQGIHAEIIDVPMLKPFDVQGVQKKAEEFDLLVSVEEHNVAGGMGSIISEILTDDGSAVRLLRIGLPDEFSAGYGKLSAVRAENGLAAQMIVEKILEYCNE